MPTSINSSRYIVYDTVSVGSLWFEDHKIIQANWLRIIISILVGQFPNSEKLLFWKRKTLNGLPYFPLLVKQLLTKYMIHIIDIPETMGLSAVYVQSIASTKVQIHCGPQITLSHYHHYADLFEGIILTCYMVCEMFYGSCWNIWFSNTEKRMHKHLAC